MQGLSKNLILRIFLFLAVPAVALGALLVVDSQPLDALSCYDCSCPSFETKIGPFWGMGSDCTQALNDALATARSQVDCSGADQCSERYEIVTQCHFSSEHNDYRIDIDYYYACEICFDKCV